ncbi:ANTAR domain-containing protein [Streptomyces sp. NPDC092129]|uniref:ANTAR domain-containing protein n=1 Tax=Streptomyces sp. NPDC092129 TaxID=3366010 RepID=UPI00382A56E6
MGTHADEFSEAAAEPGDHTAERIKELQGKVAQLEQAVDSHALIDQAIGVIVAVGRLTPDTAWDLLRETSMCTNIKLRHVAELVITWGATGHLAADLREELARRLPSPDSILARTYIPGQG